MLNRPTLKLPARSGTTAPKSSARAAASDHRPGDPLDPDHGTGDPIDPDQNPGDPIEPDHGPGDPVQPVHHVRYPLLKAFWRDLPPAPAVVSTVRRRPKTIAPT